MCGLGVPIPVSPLISFRSSGSNDLPVCSYTRIDVRLTDNSSTSRSPRHENTNSSEITSVTGWVARHVTDDCARFRSPTTKPYMKKRTCEHRETQCCQTIHIGSVASLDVTKNEDVQSVAFSSTGQEEKTSK